MKSCVSFLNSDMQPEINKICCRHIIHSRWHWHKFMNNMTAPRDLKETRDATSYYPNRISGARNKTRTIPAYPIQYTSASSHLFIFCSSAAICAASFLSASALLTTCCLRYAISVSFSSSLNSRRRFLFSGDTNSRDLSCSRIHSHILLSRRCHSLKSHLLSLFEEYY